LSWAAKGEVSLPASASASLIWMTALATGWVQCSLSAPISTPLLVCD
jgi:hypothetical protein